MVKMKATDARQEIIPDGDVVQARLEGVELREFDYEGETVRKLRWRFVVTEPPFEGTTVYGDSSFTFTNHPNCKAYNWVAALTGRRYEDGEELDTDILLGLPCRLLITYKEDKNGKWMRVKELLPARPQQAVDDSPEDAPF